MPRPLGLVTLGSCHSLGRRLSARGVAPGLLYPAPSGLGTGTREGCQNREAHPLERAAWKSILRPLDSLVYTDGCPAGRRGFPFEGIQRRFPCPCDVPLYFCWPGCWPFSSRGRSTATTQ